MRKKFNIVIICIVTMISFSMFIFAATTLNTINNENSSGLESIHETSAPLTETQIISPTVTDHKIPTPIRTSKVTQTSVKANASAIFSVKLWAPEVYYEEGTVVSYRKGFYKCLQGHISLVGWEPSGAPALWQRL